MYFGMKMSSNEILLRQRPVLGFRELKAGNKTDGINEQRHDTGGNGEFD
jgi:hypothetical protein